MRHCALPCVLRDVHGDVRVAQQLLGPGIAGGREIGERDADGRVGEDLAAVEHERLLEQVVDAACGGDGVTVGRGLEQDRELVAADARDRVAARGRGCEPRADRREQPVARDVAERVVDGLEVVEVEHQHGNRRLRRVVALERVHDAAAEEGAVREARRQVVEGLVGEPVLELHAAPSRRGC